MTNLVMTTCSLDGKRERLQHFADFPFRSVFERFDSLGLVEMQHCIELKSRA